MTDTKQFFDTNILLYLLSEDVVKADRAEELIAGGGIISVQVLNEFASVASRKLQMSWVEIREVLEPIRRVCKVSPVIEETHERGIDIAERYGLAFYDSTIVSAALQNDCQILYSEDMQHGQIFDKQLTLCNPFV